MDAMDGMDFMDAMDEEPFLPVHSYIRPFPHSPPPQKKSGAIMGAAKKGKIPLQKLSWLPPSPQR